MDNIDHLIRKVSKYVSFGQPIASGSVVSQRVSDPRIPMLAYYLSLKALEDDKNHYHEVWLKKDGLFAITDAWYRESTVSRKLLQDNLTFEQLKKHYGDEESHNIALRISEIIKKSEKEDWKPYSAKRF
ncbi:hypothetical protein RAC89_07385 [Paenibacillus sp. GD4]|jgi:hypothetical protein|uniref:hypothetical protein n=1 Tax=Paenibacillus TaxID=44249 RepID=UPI002543E311|nr:MULTISPECIES: hypothetical protein [Paenibacillus]MDQ1910320.1 hypothetical protein [Paenibacillus sp. GD4]